jgi:hypothetical protein
LECRFLESALAAIETRRESPIARSDASNRLFIFGSLCPDTLAHKFTDVRVIDVFGIPFDPTLSGFCSGGGSMFDAASHKSLSFVLLQATFDSALIAGVADSACLQLRQMLFVCRNSDPRREQ